ncbi:MAG: STAS domain-containing protein [Planctomycetaceae bacterium]|nr:STAS domain-containing protein [Planctomycetaceae bacterium]
MKKDAQKQTVADVRWQGRAAVVAVKGEIDLSCSSEFQNSLLDLLKDKPESIVVDLSSVPHMDSSGIASLVKLLGRSRKVSVPVRLAGLQKRVQSLFEITRLDRVFEIYPGVKEALAT